MEKIELKDKMNLVDIIDSTDSMVILDFYADWCNPCRALKNTFKEIENEFDDVVLIPININDDNDIVVAQYGIRSIPTLIFIKQGEQLHSISGYRTPDEMRKIIIEINK